MTSTITLADRIRLAHDKAATPAFTATVDPERVDVEAWDHVGDPLCEELLTELRDRKLMGGDVLANARRLRVAGVAAADAFLADVESTPAWVDFDAMRAGARFGLRHPIGMMLGIHGALPLTYADGATARVMASTSRMLRPEAVERRFWETATGFIGALDVEGMKPGGQRWEQWVRIRLLHSSIRMGILRSGRWDTGRSMPISQAATAAGAHLFGTYRLNVMRHFGGRPTELEAHGFELMWRWIARIEGASTELLGTTPVEQLRLVQRIGAHLYRPTADSQTATTALVDGLARMKSVFPFSRRVHAGIARRLLAEDLTQIFAGHELADDLGLTADRRTDLVAAAATRVLRGLDRAIAAIPSTPESDLRQYDALLKAKLNRRPATYEPTPVAGDPG